MFAYLGYSAAIATALCWSFTALFFSFSGRRMGANVVSRSRLLFALPLFVGAHLLLQGSLFPWDAEPFRWFWLTISSIVGLVLGDTFLFIAYATIGARLSMLMMSLAPILSIAAGWILFDERLTTSELAGIALTVFGIIWVVTARRTGAESALGRRAYGVGLLAALAGATGQALNLITARFGLVGDFSAVSAALIRLLVAIIILWGLTLVQGQVRHFVGQWRDRQGFRAMIGGTIVGPFLGIWFSLIAIQLAPLGVASTLMALSPVIIIPVNYVLFRERASARSLVGTLIAFAGVALIFLG